MEHNKNYYMLDQNNTTVVTLDAWVTQKLWGTLVVILTRNEKFTLRAAAFCCSRSPEGSAAKSRHACIYMCVYRLPSWCYSYIGHMHYINVSLLNVCMASFTVRQLKCFPRVTAHRYISNIKLVKGHRYIYLFSLVLNRAVSPYSYSVMKL